MKALVLSLMIGLTARGAFAGQEFVRGDVNGDGKVSLADCHYLHQWLVSRGPSPGCNDTGDVDDDGRFRVDDSMYIFRHLSIGEFIPPPFPLAGPDPTPNGGAPLAGCASYGGGEALTDGMAKLKILNATAEADGIATIRVAMSSSRSIAGFRGTLRLAGIIANFSGRLERHYALPVPDDLTGTVVTISQDPQFTIDSRSFIRVTDDALDFGFLRMRPWMPDWIPPGDEVPVTEFKVCLAEGVREGSYPLTLVGGELVDAETGREIVPALEEGVLTVLADVLPGSGCPGVTPQKCPPPFADLKDLRAVFSLPEVAARPGESFSVPLNIFATGDIRLYAFSVDFNEEILEATGVDFTFEKPDGSEYHWKSARFNEHNLIQGSSGMDEGFLIGGAHFSRTDDCNNIPALVETEACRLNLRVLPDAQPGSYGLKFMDGVEWVSVPRGLNQAYFVFGRLFLGERAEGFTFLDGTVHVVPDAPLFRRGDADRDGKVNITDAINLLGFLFLGGSSPLCPDAMDANDDRRLDVSDAVASLGFLFLGEAAIPAPGPSVCGPDPTEDAFGPCFYDPAGC